MTYGEIKNLYKSGELTSTSVWTKEVNHQTQDFTDANEIICGTYNGKFYIAFNLVNGWVLNYRVKPSKVVGSYRNTYVKEFDNPVNANNYFKKCRDGYRRVM